MDDIKLLSLIQHKANYSITDLATILNEEKSLVENRIKELEQDDIICGYHTIINWNKTTREKVSAIIFVDAVPEKEVGYDNIARKIYNYPEVESMHLMSGQNDFIIRLNSATMKEISDFVATRLATIQGITSTQTLIVLQTYKSNGSIFKTNEEKDERLIVSP